MLVVDQVKDGRILDVLQVIKLFLLLHSHDEIAQSLLVYGALLDDSSLLRNAHIQSFVTGCHVLIS